MVTAISAGPYASRQVARAGDGQPTTVLYRSPTYTSHDVRETMRRGMNVAGITRTPIRLVAFAWGKDNVDIAAIQENTKSLGNPWADCYSVRDGKPVHPANFCSRELEQLVQELDLAARKISRQQNPRTNLSFRKVLSARNSNSVPLLVNCVGSFPDQIHVADYSRTITSVLGGETALAIVFAYGTDASGTFEPAADVLAFPANQLTPENPDMKLHTIVGKKEWQPAGICRAEANLTTQLYLNQITNNRGFQKGADMQRLVRQLAQN